MPPGTPVKQQLFDEKFMRKLEQLALAAKRNQGSRMKGERRSVRRGTSMEFADYRPYVHGDDLRQIDWNIYGRLERLFLKLFEEEENINIHLLVDASKSMDWGKPSKLNYALKVAAALGYIGLTGNDNVMGAILSDGKSAPIPLRRTKSGMLSLFNFLSGVTPGGTTDLSASIQQYAPQIHHGGLSIVISDLLSNNGYEAAFRLLLTKGCEPLLLHVLDPSELDPRMAGDLRLIDIETDQMVDLTLDPGVIRLYREKMHAWRESIRQFCSRHDVKYIPILTTTPFEDLIFQFMRKRGVFE